MAHRGRNDNLSGFVADDVVPFTTSPGPSGGNMPPTSTPATGLSPHSSTLMSHTRDSSPVRHHSKITTLPEKSFPRNLSTVAGPFGDGRSVSASSEDGPFGDSQRVLNSSKESFDQLGSRSNDYTLPDHIPMHPLSQHFPGLADLFEESHSEQSDQVSALPRKNGDSNFPTRDGAVKDITCTFKDYVDDTVQEQYVLFEKRESEEGRRDSISNTIRQGSVVAKGALRKGSVVALEALGSVNIMKDFGNPLEISVNETVRLSSAPFRKSDSFEGRRKTGVRSNIGRKPSMHGYSTLPPTTVQRATDDPDDFVIQRLAAHDDIEHMSRWKRIVYASAPLWAFLALASYWAYFGLRVRYIVDAQTANHKIYIMAWIFVAVEIFVAFPMVMHRSWSMLMIRGRRRPKLRLVGNSVPSVDVIITCCGEDDGLVLDTAMAACNIDYPADRFRVLILDDGASAELRAMVEDPTKHSFDNMHYLSRPKYPGVPHHFKAGNLNYALAETKLMPGGAANFFAALDADMIPEKDWLRALLPHLLQDPKCSMACPPQVS
jgi:hypothetical protein